MIDEEIIVKYTGKETPLHRFYKESVAIEEELNPHCNGEYPVKLIETARPNEPSIYKDYRKHVWEPITKTYCDKIINMLSKISMADDFNIKWPEFKRDFPKGENPLDYLSEKYPDFKSIENWFFSIGLDSMVDDPNCVVGVYPEVPAKSDNEYLKPIAHIFKSCEVVGYKNNELCVIKLNEVPDSDMFLLGGMSIASSPSVLIFFDKNTVEKWVKIKDGDSEAYTDYYTYEHNTNLLPCFKMGGKIKKYEHGEKLFESIIQSCIPHFNEAARRYSDHQVNMVLHLHPDRWEIADSQCKVCKGNGTINSTVGGTVQAKECKTCGGAGKVTVKTPFGTKLIQAEIKTGPNGSTSIPTPPMGYANRPIESIDYLNKEWKSDIQQGLSALNMEFLMFEPAVNSGIAKALDRSELNAYIYSVASHIVNNILIPVQYIILKQRYGVVASEEEIHDMLPSIKIPVKFDIIMSSFFLELSKTAKDSGVPGNVLDQMYLEYAAKEFGKDSMAYMLVLNRMLLDPLPHMNVDEKMTTLANKGCTEEQYIISSQLDSFLIRAFDEDKAFGEKKLAEKNIVISGYAKEVSQATKDMVIPIMSAA